MNKKAGALGLLVLIFIVAGLFSYNSNKILNKHEIELAINQKIEENNINAQKSFGALIKQKIEIKKIKIIKCDEAEIMTCNAQIDLNTFRGEENQEVKVKLEKNQGKWQVMQLSKV